MCILGVSILLAVFAWTCANDVLALSKKESKEVVIEVDEGESFSHLSKKLKKEGVIDQAWLFDFYCKFSKAKVDPGKYTMTLPLDYRAIIYALKKGSPSAEEITVIIREGLTLAQTFEILEQNGVSTVEKLMETEATYPFKHWFLNIEGQEIPLGAGRLEGYLYPDTYDFFLDENPVKVINKLLNNFNTKFIKDFRDEVERGDYTLHEIVTIASLIESEATNDEDDRKRISAVINNRLNKNKWESGLLQVDASVVYILKNREDELEDSIKKELKDYLEKCNRDKTEPNITKQIVIAMKTKHPYNTDNHPGLPPGPISSPSIDSIRAALYPSAETAVKGETITKATAAKDWRYYALTDSGVHEFTTSLKDHNTVKDANPKTYPKD